MDRLISNNHNMKALILQLLLFILILNFSPCTSSAAGLLYHLCQGNQNYTTNSTFESNLNMLLNSLSNTTSTFFTDIVGSGPNRVYGLVQCRGDINIFSDCSKCYENSVQSVLRGCTYSRQATIWYEICQLRYSDAPFFSTVSDDSVRLLGATTNSTEFGKLAEKLMVELLSSAAYNSSIMFATGKLVSDMLGVSPVMYGLVQCTRDLSEYRCGDCLREIVGNFWKRYGPLNGADVLKTSCIFRYEVYPFYHGQPTITLTLPSPQARKDNKNISAPTLVIVILVAAVVLFSTLWLCFWRKKAAKNISGVPKLEISGIESILFDLPIVKAATSDFNNKNKLGQGGFGTVYKGTLPNGEDIAVKRLSTSSKQGIEELKNELLLLSKLHHKNLVRLRGICLEEEEKLLIYEFVPNKSLDTILFDSTKCKQLNWETRFRIIGGIARGLQYLHEESNLKVIHRDLKASNILLDAGMNPKISDFGLARLFKGDGTPCITNRVVGTFGYMAPEYTRHGKFSLKLDVYSFGILILEIVTGRKNSSFHGSEHDQDLLSYVREHRRKGTMLEIIDPSLGEHYQRNEVVKCIQVGLLCAHQDPLHRPTMPAIVLMLQAPLQPRLDTSGMNIPEESVNEVSISEMHPR